MKEGRVEEWSLGGGAAESVGVDWAVGRGWGSSGGVSWERRGRYAVLASGGVCAGECGGRGECRGYAQRSQGRASKHGNNAAEQRSSGAQRGGTEAGRTDS
jgi:hypothetical protein